MPITFPCPTCQLRMTVPDTMAGKRGKCRKCQGLVVVPAPVAAAAIRAKPAPPPAAPPPPPPPPASEDLEAAALDALAEPKQEQEQDAEAVEFNCPQCDELVKLPLEVAGKRNPCPSCRRIILVPVPQKQKEKDWRDTGPKQPAGAKRDVGPALEGAWGAGQAAGVSTEALKEAGVIKERERPLTFYQRYQTHMLIAFPAILLLVGGWFLWGWWMQGTEAAALARAASLGNSDAGPTALAALAAGTAEYHLRGKRPGSAKEASDQLGKALRFAQQLPAASRAALLLDLLPTYLDLGGDTEAARDDKRLKWDDAQRQIFQAVNAISSIDAYEPRLMAVRAMAVGLAGRGQTARVFPLASQLGAGTAPERQAEILATAGLGLFQAGDQAGAARLAAMATKLYAVKKRPPLRPAVVAICIALGIKPPAKKGHDDDDAFRFGTIEGLAAAGKADEAKKAAESDKFNRAEQFRAAVTAGDIEQALNLGQSRLPGTHVDWARLRLAKMAAKAGADAGKVGRMVDAMASADLQAWGRLAVLRHTLAEATGVVSEDALAGLPSTTLAGLLARMELARHNCRLNSGWTAKFKDWDETERAFGWLGAAQAMQPPR